MRKTKIAFLQRGWEDNLGILWILAVLKKNGFDAEAWVDNRDTYCKLRDFSPDIVGYSCVTGQQQWLHASVRRLKEAGIKAKIIVGGPHPTFFPELINDPLIDVICRGEGEMAMLDYAVSIDEGRGDHSIKNLSFKLDGQIIKNDLRPLVTDLDTLPRPDRSYYGKYKFFATNPYKIFITGRGCPFQCTFCFNHALHQLYGQASRYVRRHSVEYVIGELLEVRKRWGINEVRFSDDHFALDADWLKDFAAGYRKEINRPYSINARVDILDEDKISLLKESGCRLVCFGVETGEEEQRNALLKKEIKDEEIFNAARLLRKHGVKFLTSNIIGLPHESAASAWKTVELNQRIKTDLPWFSMMQYYPGTQIYSEAKDQGVLGDDYNVNAIKGYFDNAYLKQENLGELQNIHSFSIIASRSRALTPLFKFFSRRFRPNAVFKFIFLLSYLYVTFKRTNLRLWRILKWPRHYLLTLARQ